eukprot:comp21711_c0_seq9/m.48361 comp21711_c0_seq9/g.48361  ORF comp21711_c0_seq9/g.48361 comp21711_c0_seq9/m.48361 type:complete len:974 (-) comp21711_c0_seq9:98-3019(-)
MLKRGTLVLCCVLLCTIGASAAKLRGGLSDPAAAPNQEPSQDILLAAGAPADELGRALGMQSGEIPDSALSASTIHGWNEYYGPRNARLLGGHDYGCFIPNNNAANEWVQVDLGRIRPVGGVAFQGRRTGSYWVRNFFIQYSAYNQNDWTWYTDSGTGERKEFSGNWDENTIVSHVFTRPFEARYIRVYANQFQGWPCWRFELYAPKNDAESSGESLGLAGYTIPDSAFSASSAHGNNWGYYGPQWSRLDGSANWGGWIPNNNRAGEWIQVDLGKVVDVGGIATQGRAHGSYWVTSYTLAYSNDGESWKNYGIENNPEVLTGNDDYNTVVKLELRDFKARYVRLIIDAFANGWPTLRWEIYAPERPQNRLGKALGLGNMNIPDSAFTASSAHGNNWDYYGPRHARLFGGGPWGGWIPNNNAGGEWVQVDLGRVHEIGGIATQGRRWGSYWVRSYMVAYSQDGKEWGMYSMEGEQTIFDGNSDYNSVVRHVFQAPFLARYVRVIVRSFANGWPTLRFELYSPHDSRNRDLADLGVPFGLENGNVPNEALSASSTYRTDDNACAASNGRLNGKAGSGAWIASNNNLGQYFEIRTGDAQREIGGIAIQGRNPDSDAYKGGQQWVTAFTVSYTDDDKFWTEYKEDNALRYFRGNMDGITVTKHAFKVPFKALAVRINPTSWYGAIALRAELYDSAAYRKKVAEDERIAKIKAAELAEAQAAALKEKLAQEEFAKKKALEELRLKEKAAMEEARAADVAEHQAKTAAAKAAAAELEKRAEQELANLKAKEAALEKAKSDSISKIEAAKSVAEAKMRELQAKLDQHRADNRKLAAAKEKLQELKQRLSKMKMDELDAMTTRMATSADHADERKKVRDLTKKVASKLEELYKLRESYSERVRQRESGIRDSEERSYLHFLENNNPWRKTDPAGWPVNPKKKICTCKDMEDPLNAKGRKLGTKAAVGKDDPTYDAFKGKRE